MFQNFSDFTRYIESLPALEINFEQKQALLLKAKAFVKAEGLIPQVPIVTVTGTNGKGSTVKALAEILQYHGYRVSAFTSPHLISYTERFSYNHGFIDETTLVRLANQLACLIDLSEWNFFFILVFIFLLWCKELQLDCLILEVGIGGRLDPTNILDASLIILTQIALDHTEILGDTREQIAFEKMGLLREHIPLVCGELNPPATVIEKAAQLHGPIYQIGKQFGFTAHGDIWDLWLGTSYFLNLPLPLMHLSSLSCAFQAAQLIFPEIHFQQKFLELELPKIYLPGRYQHVMYQGYEFVVDVSHNPAAVEALAEHLRSLPKKYLCAIFAVKANKDILQIIDLMKNVVDEWYLVSMDFAGGMDTSALARCFSEFSIKTNIVTDVSHAIEEITTKQPTNTRVAVFGSFRIAGPVLDFIENGP